MLVPRRKPGAREDGGNTNNLIYEANLRNVGTYITVLLGELNPLSLLYTLHSVHWSPTFW